MNFDKKIVKNVRQNIKNKNKNKSKTKNVSVDDVRRIKDLINQLYREAYGKSPSQYRKLQLDKLRIILPGRKVYTLDVDEAENIKYLLSSLLANVDKPPFTDTKENIYAFELLWILLTIIATNRVKADKMIRRNAFTNVRIVRDVADSLPRGKYIFRIPKYKSYNFDVRKNEKKNGKIENVARMYVN